MLHNEFYPKSDHIVLGFVLHYREDPYQEFKAQRYPETMLDLWKSAGAIAAKIVGDFKQSFPEGKVVAGSFGIGVEPLLSTLAGHRNLFYSIVMTMPLVWDSTAFEQRLLRDGYNKSTVFVMIDPRDETSLGIRLPRDSSAFSVIEVFGNPR